MTENWTIKSCQLIGANFVQPSIVFNNQVTGKPIVTIKPDGSIEIGEGATNDDAARAFWAGVERMGLQREAIAPFDRDACMRAVDARLVELSFGTRIPEAVAELVKAGLDAGLKGGSL